MSPSIVEPEQDTPAELTIISIRPVLSTAELTSLRTCSASVTSAVNTVALPPKSLIFFLLYCIDLVVRQQK
jgi:hypothetical protein